MVKYFYLEPDLHITILSIVLKGPVSFLLVFLLGTDRFHFSKIYLRNSVTFLLTYSKIYKLFNSDVPVEVGEIMCIAT